LNCDAAYQSSCTAGTVMDIEGNPYNSEASQGIGKSYYGEDSQRVVDSFGGFATIGMASGRLDLHLPNQSTMAPNLQIGTDTVVPSFSMIELPGEIQIKDGDEQGNSTDVYSTGWDFVTHNYTITYSTVREPAKKINPADIAKCANVGNVVAN